MALLAFVFPKPCPCGFAMRYCRHHVLWMLCRWLVIGRFGKKVCYRINSLWSDSAKEHETLVYECLIVVPSFCVVWKFSKAWIFIWGSKFNWWCLADVLENYIVGVPDCFLNHFDLKGTKMAWNSNTEMNMPLLLWVLKLLSVSKFKVHVWQLFAKLQ